MEIFGKSTINPILYWTGKAAGVINWAVITICMIKMVSAGWNLWEYYHYIAFVVMIIALIIIAFSLINLGSSTRVGLPKEDTNLKINGLYKFSRNPIYVGGDLLIIASIICTLNVWVAIMGIYSLIVYHLIILGEEKFLKKRFGEEYLQYIQKVRRYI